MSKNSKILQKNMSFPQKMLKTVNKSAKIPIFLDFFSKTVEKSITAIINIKYLFFIKTQDKTEIPIENINTYLFLLYMLINIFD